MIPTPTEPDLVYAIKSDAEKTIRSLYQNHPENFYYISLITTDQGNCPYVTTWSTETLNAALEKEENPDKTRLDLKRSCTASPDQLYGQAHFDPIWQLFNQRKTLLNTDN